MKPGLVLVSDVDHRGPELGIHADALDIDDARAAVGKDGTGHVARLVLGHDRHRDQAVVVVGGLAGGFLNDDAALLGDDRGRHHIHVLQHRAQQAGERRRGQRLGLQPGRRRPRTSAGSS